MLSLSVDYEDKLWNKTETTEFGKQLFNEIDNEHRVRRSAFYQTQKDLAARMTKTLDELVGSNYDRRIRPNYGGKSVEVELNLSINGMVIIFQFGYMKMETFRYCKFKVVYISSSALIIICRDRSTRKHRYG